MYGFLFNITLGMTEMVLITLLVLLAQNVLNDTKFVGTDCEYLVSS